VPRTLAPNGEATNTAIAITATTKTTSVDQ
jgi:hypothetical protein